MSATVDNRVVDMGFNNQQFEKGVKESTESLTKLKDSLNLAESAKGLNALDAAGKKLDFSGIGNSVQSVANRFSTMGIIGITVLQNLTNAAIQYGKKMVDNFLTPMRTGFQEYETQMNAVQTVLANTESKGTTLSDVNEALNELNTYADKTIYNFTEMTKNIGTFTAAGVDLNTSVAAIKGIANLAAVSGSNSQQASTAMYQLSQALSSGTVKLMDWNSVVNAGMGGQVFQEALKATARVHGIKIDEMLKKEGSFRETLSNGWLSSQILLETLQKFTGDLTAEQLKNMGYADEQIDAIIKLGETANNAATKVKTFTQLKDTLAEAMQSGWTQSWQLIIGDFEEAKTLFTEISDTLGAMIGNSADARNAIISEWRSFGGRELAIDTIRKGFEAFLKIVAPIKAAWKQIFPGEHLGLTLATLTDDIHDFVAALRISDETAAKLQRIFAGLFAILAIGRDVIFGLLTPLKNLLSGVSIDGSGFLDFLANLGDKIVEFEKNGNIADTISKAISTLIEKVREYWAIIGTEFGKIKTKIASTVKSIQAWFTSLFSKIDFGPVTDFFNRVEVRFEPLKALATATTGVLGLMLKAAVKIMPWVLKLGGAVAGFVAGLVGKVHEALMNVDFKKVFDLINTGLIGAFLLAIRNFLQDGGGALESVGGMFGGVTEILDGVRGSLEAFQNNLKAKTLLTIAAAIGILALSLIAISLIDSAKLTMSLAAITGLFIDLMGAMAIFGKLKGAGLGPAAGLVALSAAVLIMAAALTVLSKIEPANVQNGLGAIYALTATMLVFSKLMSGSSSSGLIKSAISLGIYAVALLVLGESVKRLGALDPATLTNGLIAVGAMLAEIAIFMRLIGDGKVGITAGIAMAGMAGAILLLSLAVEKYGKMDIGVLKQGLAVLGIIFAEIGGFTRLVGDGKRILATAVGMTIISGAMFILLEVMTRMAKLSWEELGKGLAGIAGSLLIIALAVRAMPGNMIFQSVALIGIALAISVLGQALKSLGNMSWEELGRGLLALAGSLAVITLALYGMSGTLPGSLALIVAAGALWVLAGVMQTLGSMPLSEIGIALLALAGIFTVLGIAGLVLTPLVPTILALGGAMLMVGAGAALIGVGLMLFSIGLAGVAASGMAAAITIAGMVTTFLGLVPVIIKTLIDSIIVFGEGIIKATPVVAKAIKELLLAALQIIIDITPKLFEALDGLLKGLIKLVVDNGPDFISAIVTLLLSLLTTIADNLPEFLQAGFDILIEFLKGIRDNIAEVVTVVSEIITEFLTAVGDNLPDVIQSGWDLIIDFINGMADSVDKNMQPAIDAMGRLATAIIDGIVGGLATGAQTVINALVQLAKDAIAAVFKQFDTGSPSKVMIVLGKSIPQGIVVGVKALAKSVPNAVKKLANTTIDAMSKALSAVTDGVNGDINLDPVIRPVVDMTDVMASGRLLDDILGDRSMALVNAAAGSASTPQSVMVDSDGKQVPVGSTVEFNQYNYSPKALSRVEIYRQTRNQLRGAKGVLTP